jgi:hypothetical protein
LKRLETFWLTTVCELSFLPQKHGTLSSSAFAAQVRLFLLFSFLASDELNKFSGKTLLEIDVRSTKVQPYRTFSISTFLFSEETSTKTNFL